LEQIKNQQNLIGGQLRRLRVERGLSQEGLSAQFQLAGWDLSRASLSKIEAGLRRVNDAELWMMAKVMNITVAELFPKRPADLGKVLRHGRG